MFVTAVVVAPIVIAAIAIMVLAAHVSDLSYEAAFASRFVNGPAGASAQSDENAAAVAMRVVDGTPTWAACPLGHSKIVAEIAIGAETSAVEPGLVKELASLHVKAYSDEARFAERIR